MRTTRRNFLKSVAKGTVGAALTPALVDRAIAARAWCGHAPLPATHRLVFINLEGAYDALAMLRPITGAAATTYDTVRPVLAPLTSTIPLPGVPDFGLHPSLSLIANEFAANKCAIIQKVGMPAPQLSHFAARDLMALGRATHTHPNRTGWLGRLADSFYTSSLDVVGMGVSAPLILNSNLRKPAAITNLDNFVLNNFLSQAETNQRRTVLSQMVAQHFVGDRIGEPTRGAISRGASLSQQIVGASAGVNPAGNYGDVEKENLAKSLKDIAKMIGASSLPSRVFYTNSFDFDTHGYEEELGVGAAKPTLTERLDAVMQAIGAFVSDLKSPAIGGWNDTVIVLYTEFGRRIAENQTRGTDHGWGFHMFLLGGPVQGGLKGTPVTNAELTGSNVNLPVQIDYRNVFRNLVTNWLGFNGATIFDDYVPGPAEPVLTLV